MGPNYDLLKINKYMYKYKANILQNFELFYLQNELNRYVFTI